MRETGLEGHYTVNH